FRWPAPCRKSFFRLTCPAGSFPVVLAELVEPLAERLAEPLVEPLALVARLVLAARSVVLAEVLVVLAERLVVLAELLVERLVEPLVVRVVAARYLVLFRCFVVAR
ncbi:MAG: hypothetical protein KC475_07030, partial [Cyanobacteria bacterium HKST-UBA03]|nr:hypothetical protein [Cyanobacteria bacterium HKST-UBA03]